jgi:hypothetical protein
MSLAVISEPGLISLSKNPCEFHLRSSAWVNQQPVAGVWELVFTTKLATLASLLTFTWGGNEVTFIVQATGATPTGYNLPQDIAATTLAQYVEQLANDFFKAQFLLDKDFDIEYVAPDTIRFTAKDAANVLTTSTTIPGGEATISNTTTPIQISYLDNYQVIMDVEVEETYGSGNYTRVGTIHATPTLYNDGGTLKGDVKLDVQEILHGFLQDKQDRPNIGIPTSTQAAATNLQWRVVYAEQYTILGELTTVRRIQCDNKQLMKGGLKHLDVPALGDLETNYYGVTNKPWQTWQPDGKEVTQAEKHWLYFKTPFQITGADYYELTAEVFYTDGTTATSVINTNAAQQRWDVYYYRVGFEDEGLDALTPPGETPYKYTVQLTETGGGMASAVFTFYLVDSTRQDRLFLFENSFGGFDTLRCNGDMQALAEFSKTESVVPVQAGYAATDAVVKVKSQGYGDSFEVFSGFKPLAEIIYLRDFLNSENVYEIVDGALVPVVVNTGRTFKLEHRKTGEYGYGLQFSYRHAFMNKGYSNA